MERILIGYFFSVISWLILYAFKPAKEALIDDICNRNRSPTLVSKFQQADILDVITQDLYCGNLFSFFQLYTTVLITIGIILLLFFILILSNSKSNPKNQKGNNYER